MDNKRRPLEAVAPAPLQNSSKKRKSENPQKRTVQSFKAKKSQKQNAQRQAAKVDQMEVELSA